ARGGFVEHRGDHREEAYGAVRGRGEWCLVAIALDEHSKRVAVQIVLEAEVDRVHRGECADPGGEHFSGALGRREGREHRREVVTAIPQCGDSALAAATCRIGVEVEEPHRSEELLCPTGCLPVLL